jgi:hypothetical protein
LLRRVLSEFERRVKSEERQAASIEVEHHDIMEE